MYWWRILAGALIIALAKMSFSYTAATIGTGPINIVYIAVDFGLTIVAFVVGANLIKRGE